MRGVIIVGMPLLAMGSAALAQDLAGEAKREVLRQECRLPAQGDEIVVCGKRDRNRRYQVTDPNAPFDPAGNTKSVFAERGAWVEEGDTGPGSCSPVGPGGWTGCMQKTWRRQRQQKGWLN